MVTVPSYPVTLVTKHARPSHEVLEELVASVLSLDSKMREVSDGGMMSPRRRRMKFHPMVFMDLMHMGRVGRGDPLRLLMIASVFREDMPWLYELAMEVYRATKAGMSEDAERARRYFRRAMEDCMHGPFAEEMGLDPEMHHMLIQEIEHLMHSEPQPEEDSKGKAKHKRDEKEKA